MSGESCDGKYAVCKKFAKILYSDRTVSYEDIPAKTPIGIVVDEKKKIAVSLTYDSRVYNDWQSIPHKYPQSWEDLTFYDIPAIENCDNLQIFDMKAGWIDNPKCLNRDGKSETAKIAAYAKSSGITHLRRMLYFLMFRRRFRRRLRGLPKDSGIWPVLKIL